MYERDSKFLNPKTPMQTGNCRLARCLTKTSCWLVGASLKIAKMQPSALWVIWLSRDSCAMLESRYFRIGFFRQLELW